MGLLSKNVKKVSVAWKPAFMFVSRISETKR